MDYPSRDPDHCRLSFSEIKQERMILTSVSDIPEPGKARMRFTVTSQPCPSLRAPTTRFKA
jgi:hypothetical protein